MTAPVPLYTAVHEELILGSSFFVFDMSPVVCVPDECLFVLPWSASSYDGRNQYNSQLYGEITGPSEWTVEGPVATATHRFCAQVQHFPGATLKDEGDFHPSSWTSDNSFHDHPWNSGKVFDPTKSILIVRGTGPTSINGTNVTLPYQFFTAEKRANELRVHVGARGVSTIDPGWRIYYQIIEAPWIKAGQLQLVEAVNATNWESDIVVPAYTSNKTTFFMQGAGTTATYQYNWPQHQAHVKPGASNTLCRIRAQRGGGAFDLTIGFLGWAEWDGVEVQQTYQEFHNPDWSEVPENTSENVTVPTVGDLANVVYPYYGLHHFNDIWGFSFNEFWGPWQSIPIHVDTSTMRFERLVTTSIDSQSSLVFVEVGGSAPAGNPRCMSIV